MTLANYARSLFEPDDHLFFSLPRASVMGFLEQLNLVLSPILVSLPEYRARGNPDDYANINNAKNAIYEICHVVLSAFPVDSQEAQLARTMRTAIIAFDNNSSKKGVQ